MSKPQKKIPTKDSLVKLLKEVLKLDVHFDALCVAHFSDVANEFSAGMLRTQKMNILLEMRRPEEILEKLRQGHPEAVRLYESLLVWETVLASVDSVLVSSVISDPLRKRILKIVGATTWAPSELKDAYYESTPLEWRHHFDGDRGEDLGKRMLSRIATIVGQTNGIHPILYFALHLMKRTEASPSLTELSRWVRAAASYLGVDPERLNELQRTIERAPLHPPRDLHLVVVMTEVPAELDRYAVWAFRVLVPRGKKDWSDNDDAILMKSVTECSYALDEMPALLNALHDEIVGDLERSDNELTIELVVPLQLLSHDADRWELALGMGTTSLFGVQYNVVVRSWERAYGKDRQKIRAQWVAKWGRIHNVSDEATWTCPERDAQAGIALKLHTGGPSCVALEFAPVADAGGNISQVLRALIATGTPVVAWSRVPPSDESRFKSCLEQLINAPPPRMWPSTVKSYRREAHGHCDPEHPGHHFSVLWDDPNKLVPDMCAESQLQAPSR